MLKSAAADDEDEDEELQSGHKLLLGATPKCLNYNLLEIDVRLHLPRPPTSASNLTPPLWVLREKRKVPAGKHYAALPQARESLVSGNNLPK